MYRIRWDTFYEIDMEKRLISSFLEYEFVVMGPFPTYIYNPSFSMNNLELEW